MDESLSFFFFFRSFFLSSFSHKMSPFVNSVNEKKPFIYDFVSDTATIPTEDMFDIMKLATCGDDVFQVIRSTHIFLSSSI